MQFKELPKLSREACSERHVWRRQQDADPCIESGSREFFACYQFRVFAR